LLYSKYNIGMKIVVFDLDETLGYFVQFGIFWDSIDKYLKNKNKINKLVETDFAALFDLYPEFLRPNILNILTYLKKKKKKNQCHKVLIYTNNMGPREWAQKIIAYFEGKINYKLFDQIIAAFKINGKQVEICRTTHSKTHEDLIKCTKIPADTEICFIDDVFYPDMANDSIYYINIKPYYHQLPFEEMIRRLKHSELFKRLFGDEESMADFDRDLMRNINEYNYEVFKKQADEYAVDKILGKHIIQHLQSFFNGSSKNRTAKNRGNRRNKTLKNLEG